MAIFALKELEAVVGLQDFFEILIDGKSQYADFYQKIKTNKKYISELKTILSNMDLVANLEPLPNTKFKNITPEKEVIKEFEFKSQNLRVYAFHLEKTGKIVAYWGFKNEQKKDLKQFRSIKKRFIQSI